MTETTSTEFKPPYMSFQTFWNFIDELSKKPLPPRIDRSLMSSKSGTDQANLTLALQSFGLIDAESNVRPALTGLVLADEAGRKVMLADLVRAHYSGPLTVSEKNGTQADLAAAFRDDYPSIGSADTRRKSVTFFLHAARTAGIEVSPHFPATRSGSGQPGTPKAKRSGTGTRKRQPKDEGGGSGGSAAASAGPGFSKTVELPDEAGTVTLTASVNPMALRGHVRTWFFDLVDQMDADPASGSHN